jgi:hypothetical protein
MIMQESLTISRLTSVDRFELEDSIDSEELTFQEEEVQPDTFGELGTIVATILVTKITLAALVVLYAQKHKPKDTKNKSKFVFREEVKITRIDGTVEEKRIEFEADSESSLKEGLAAHFGNIFEIDPGSILEQIAGNS